MDVPRICWRPQQSAGSQRCSVELSVFFLMWRERALRWDRTLIERWHPGCLGSEYSPVNLDESPVLAFSALASCGSASTPAFNSRQHPLGQTRSQRPGKPRASESAHRNATRSKGCAHTAECTHSISCESPDAAH
jgi:hypothetical protein